MQSDAVKYRNAEIAYRDGVSFGNFPAFLLTKIPAESY